MKSKVAFIAFVGRPSTGKSTLLNRLVPQKVSITASSPQTTRRTVRGIIQDPRGQLVILDTPGFHLSSENFNKALMNLWQESLEEVDIIVYLLDASRAPGPEEEKLAKILSVKKIPLLPVINKIDLQDSPVAQNEFLERYHWEKPLLISALKKQGLENILDRLFELSSEGEPYYPSDIYTDQNPEFRIQEAIREKTLLHLSEELPHAFYVEIVDYQAEEQKLSVRALICVEKESQKGIIVGKEGNRIREIRQRSVKALKSIFERQVYLDLRVKVRPSWKKKTEGIKKALQ